MSNNPIGKANFWLLLKNEPGIQWKIKQFSKGHHNARVLEIRRLLPAILRRHQHLQTTIATWNDPDVRDMFLTQVMEG